jgi:hypothetical protein
VRRPHHPLRCDHHSERAARFPVDAQRRQGSVSPLPRAPCRVPVAKGPLSCPRCQGPRVVSPLPRAPCHVRDAYRVRQGPLAVFPLPSTACQAPCHMLCCQWFTLRSAREEAFDLEKEGSLNMRLSRSTAFLLSAMQTFGTAFHLFCVCAAADSAGASSVLIVC